MGIDSGVENRVDVLAIEKNMFPESSLKLESCSFDAPHVVDSMRIGFRVQLVQTEIQKCDFVQQAEEAYEPGRITVIVVCQFWIEQERNFCTPVFPRDVYQSSIAQEFRAVKIGQ
jgi:hypothetical protein